MHVRAANRSGLATSVSRRRGLWRLMALVVLLAVIGGYISPVRTFIERSGQIDAEKLATEDLQAEHDRLLRERDRLNNITHVEEVARRDLGLVRPGEQPYVVKDLDRGGPQTVSAPQADDPSLTEQVKDWFASLID